MGMIILDKFAIDTERGKSPPIVAFQKKASVILEHPRLKTNRPGTPVSWTCISPPFSRVSAKCTLAISMSLRPKRHFHESRRELRHISNGWSYQLAEFGYGHNPADVTQWLETKKFASPVHISRPVC